MPVVNAIADAAPYDLFGIRLVGFNADTGRKLLITIVIIAVVWFVKRCLCWLAARLLRGRLTRAGFWVRQVIGVLAAVILIFGLASLWFDDPTRLTTALGLVTAGLAFALQKVVTAIAGYVVIMRGKTFSVGDRIVMGGVRGDVMGLDFTQTTILEMGQPPPVQNADPAVWVKSRQYTGRIVTVSNARVFDEPVFNYTRELAFIWEELMVPIAYTDDRAYVERLLLDVAEEHTRDLQDMTEEVRAELLRRHYLTATGAEPRVYLRMTDNWIELTVRFIAREHGIRELKDQMSREILAGLEKAGIGIASATFQVVGLPPVRVELAGRSGTDVPQARRDKRSQH